LCHDEPREAQRKSKGELDIEAEDGKSPKDEYAVTPTLPGASMTEESSSALMQDNIMGMVPKPDKMPNANSGVPAQPSALNGNAQTRKLNQEIRLGSHD
jgi:hypothetical protein